MLGCLLLECRGHISVDWMAFLLHWFGCNCWRSAPVGCFRPFPVKAFVGAASHDRFPCCSIWMCRITRNRANESKSRISTELHLWGLLVPHLHCNKFAAQVLLISATAGERLCGVFQCSWPKDCWIHVLLEHCYLCWGYAGWIIPLSAQCGSEGPSKYSGPCGNSHASIIKFLHRLCRLSSVLPCAIPAASSIPCHVVFLCKVRQIICSIILVIHSWLPDCLAEPSLMELFDLHGYPLS